MVMCSAATRTVSKNPIFVYSATKMHGIQYQIDLGYFTKQNKKNVARYQVIPFDIFIRTSKLFYDHLNTI